MSQQSDRKTELQATIERLRGAWWDSRVLLTAVELDLFSALADGPASAQEVASRIATAPRATARLMDALVVLGILGSEGSRYVLDDAAAALLVPGGSDYQGALQHSAHLWKSWSTLTDAVRAGTSVKERAEGAERVAQKEAFIGAMHVLGMDRAKSLVGLLDLDGVRRVLDVGGASGAYAMEFVRQGDDLRSAVFDLPDVLPMTGRYLAEAGMDDRVDTVPGDYREDGFGAGWDLIFMSNIIHINSPEENRSLIARAAAALAPGGRIVIQDFMPEDDRTGPHFAVVFSLNMLVNTTAGDTYTLSEIRQWTDAAGLRWCATIETDVPSTLVTAQRPS